MRADYFAYIVVPDSIIVQARNYADTLYAGDGEPSSERKKSFQLALSADGKMPATHWATNTALTSAMKPRMDSSPAQVAYWIVREDGSLVKSSDPNAPSRLTFDDAIASMGLRVIPRNDL